jgi:Tfp pilus assembly protein FimT
MPAAKGKGRGMTLRETFLFLALLALLGFAIAVTSGVLGGPSDIEMRVRASEPFTLQK